MVIQIIISWGIQSDLELFWKRMAVKQKMNIVVIVIYCVLW